MHLLLRSGSALLSRPFLLLALAALRLPAMAATCTSQAEMLPTDRDPLAALMAVTAASPRAADRAATYTRQPRPARASAVARPMPVLAPVTSTVRPGGELIAAPGRRSA